MLAGLLPSALTKQRNLSFRWRADVGPTLNAGLVATELTMQRNMAFRKRTDGGPTLNTGWEFLRNKPRQETK